MIDDLIRHEKFEYRNWELRSALRSGTTPRWVREFRVPHTDRISGTFLWCVRPKGPNI